MGAMEGLAADQGTGRYATKMPFGALTDGERRQRQKQEATSALLARSLAQLEQRTAALEDMQRYISNVLASLSSGVITIDAGGRVTTENRLAHVLLGASYVGQPLPHPLGEPGFLAASFRQLQLAGRPVGIIRASAQLMGSLPSIAADPTSREYVQVITHEADRVDRLVEDLLGYARAGELSLAPVDMEELVRGTAARLIVTVGSLVALRLRP
jgi:nitrogen fixation/metabolism regulation signal transduction histidine kinase